MQKASAAWPSYRHQAHLSCRLSIMTGIEGQAPTLAELGLHQDHLYCHKWLVPPSCHGMKCSLIHKSARIE